eukprot:2526606-Pyramimonas_sp.AAC.1
MFAAAGALPQSEQRGRQTTLFSKYSRPVSRIVMQSSLIVPLHCNDVRIRYQYCISSPNSVPLLSPRTPRTYVNHRRKKTFEHTKKGTKTKATRTLYSSCCFNVWKPQDDTTPANAADGLLRQYQALEELRSREMGGKLSLVAAFGPGFEMWRSTRLPNVNKKCPPRVSGVLSASLPLLAQDP